MEKCCRDCGFYASNEAVYHYCFFYQFKVNPAGRICSNYFDKPQLPEPEKKDSGCYLTSACVDYMGKTDNCEELTVLRNFRDGYMKKSAVGARLVEEYYAVAPQIVKAIDKSPERDGYYNYIYGEIKTCVALINAGKYEETQKRYTQMVTRLKEQLL